MGRLDLGRSGISDGRLLLVRLALDLRGLAAGDQELEACLLELVAGKRRAALGTQLYGLVQLLIRGEDLALGEEQLR